MVKLEHYCRYPYFFGKLPVPAASILAGLGAGLVRDDFADIKQWFRFKKAKVTNAINNC